MMKNPLMEHIRYITRSQPRVLKPKRDTWFLFIRKAELEQLKYWDKFKHELL